MKLINELNMTVYPMKTKAVWFAPEHELYQPLIRIRGVRIVFEANVRYLGVYLDEKLNFEKHIKELLAAVEKRLNVLRMLAGSKWVDIRTSS